MAKNPKIGLYDIANSTTPESNKSLIGLQQTLCHLTSLLLLTRAQIFHLLFEQLEAIIFYKQLIFNKLLIDFACRISMISLPV